MDSINHNKDNILGRVWVIFFFLSALSFFAVDSTPTQNSPSVNIELVSEHVGATVLTESLCIPDYNISLKSLEIFDDLAGAQKQNYLILDSFFTQQIKNEEQKFLHIKPLLIRSNLTCLFTSKPEEYPAIS